MAQLIQDIRRELKKVTDAVTVLESNANTNTDTIDASIAGRTIAPIEAQPLETLLERLSIGLHNADPCEISQVMDLLKNQEEAY